MSLVMGLYETLTGLEFIRQFPVGLRVAICSRVTLRRMAKGTKVVMSEDISTNPLFLLVQGHARVPKLPLLGSGDTFGYRRYARGEGDAGDGIARNGRVVVVVTEALCVELAPATCAALFGGLGQSICWAPEIARAILREPRARSEDEISLVQALVSDMPFFRAQSSELRHAVTRRIALEKVRAGAVAHSWSGPCDRIFVVLSGSFAVRLSADGAQPDGATTLATLAAGDHFPSASGTPLAQDSQPSLPPPQSVHAPGAEPPEAVVAAASSRFGGGDAAILSLTTASGGELLSLPTHILERAVYPSASLGFSLEQCRRVLHMLPATRTSDDIKKLCDSVLRPVPFFRQQPSNTCERLASRMTIEVRAAAKRARGPI